MKVAFRPNHRYLFSSFECKVAWVALTLVWGLIYFSINFFLFAPSERYHNFARAAVLSRVNYDIDELGFFCVFIYVRSLIQDGLLTEVINGETIIYISYCVGLCVMMVMMLSTFLVMICCGVQIIRALERISLSNKTRNLQHQLLRALIVQATIPFIFSYLPRFLMFAFVIKGSSKNAFTAFVPYTIALYTFLDPIAIIIFIPTLRKKIFDFRRCREVVSAVSRTKLDFSLRY
ncbi:7TM chemoreceptor [Ancylostoma caninum]|uniref:7TM chemoreceptor n=1 Tax=Ancylostoma caninum TaxID=29170 RepID=A0A368FJJ2_ANCCA|nr:7TM chemoreceptor [Ancylostoma caninum]